MRLHGTFPATAPQGIEFLLERRFTLATRVKGRHAYDTKRIELTQDPHVPEVWKVRSGENTYRVQFHLAPGVPWITCTCRSGRASGHARCYHGAAVLQAMRDAFRKVREIQGQSGK